MRDYETYGDSVLFDHIAAGDKTAFTTIFYRYSDQLYAYVLKIVNADFWAEEIVQTVFVQLWERRSELGSVENPPSYLFRIAANRAIDWMRRNESEARLQYYLVSLDTAPENEVEASFDYRNAERLVREAIRQLPEQRRRIFLLKTEGHKTYEEIAEELQISRHTVRNQLAAAMQTVRKYLLDRGILIVFLGASQIS